MQLLRMGNCMRGRCQVSGTGRVEAYFFQARLAIFVIDSLDQNVLLWFDLSQRGIVLVSSLTISAISHWPLALSHAKTGRLGPTRTFRQPVYQVVQIGRRPSNRERQKRKNQRRG